MWGLAAWTLVGWITVAMLLALIFTTITLYRKLTVAEDVIKRLERKVESTYESNRQFSQSCDEWRKLAYEYQEQLEEKPTEAELQKVLRSLGVPDEKAVTLAASLGGDRRDSHGSRPDDGAHL